MASLRRDIVIDACADDVWDAVRDFGALHRRLVTGFVRDTRLDGDDARIVTFANGTELRERLVDCDEARRRLVYAAISPRMQHYSASVEVTDDGERRTRLTWIVDLLPHDIAPDISAQMDLAVHAMHKTLGHNAGPDGAAT